VLPTLAVILVAYGMYALFSFIAQRRSGQVRGPGRWRKAGGVTLLGGIMGLGLVLWCCHSPDKTDQGLKLAGFLGTVYAEGWPARVDQTAYPPVKAQNQRALKQPAYALLHPGTPVSQIEPEKKLIRPRPSRAAKTRQASRLRKKSGRSAKVTKTSIPSSKKAKLATKKRTRKKKHSSLRSRQTNAG
jgi:hypothetical protein